MQTLQNIHRAEMGKFNLEGVQTQTAPGQLPDSRSTWIIAGSVVAVVFLIVVAAITWYYRRKDMKPQTSRPTAVIIQPVPGFETPMSKEFPPILASEATKSVMMTHVVYSGSTLFETPTLYSASTEGKT